MAWCPYLQDKNASVHLSLQDPVHVHWAMFQYKPRSRIQIIDFHPGLRSVLGFTLARQACMGQVGGRAEDVNCGLRTLLCRLRNGFS